MLAHPIEAFAVFRRWPRSVARNLLYTVIWNTLIGVVFASIDFALRRAPASYASVLLTYFIIANCCGLIIHLCFTVTRRIVGDWNRLAAWQRLALQIALPVLGVLLGVPLSMDLMGDPRVTQWEKYPAFLAVPSFFGLVVAVIIALSYAAQVRRARMDAQVAAALARAEQSERLAVEARLQLLQAQIEPHFLYNTLANVIGLVEAEPAKARRMLESFTAYLRASLWATRFGEGTLGEEISRVCALLELQGVRMAGRLKFEIDVPAPLESAPFPPMLLQPLVENAIKHGLEPKIEGGAILISARERDERLVLQVEDNGLGIAASSDSKGTGIGLSNLRHRLATLFGEHASLHLMENTPSGVTAILTLPQPRDT